MAFNSNNDSITDIVDEDILKIKALIDKDFERFELPEALKSENLIQKLDGIEQTPPEHKSQSRVIYLKFISAAACFALAIFGWQYFGSKNNTDTLEAVPRVASAQMSGATAAFDAPAAYSGVEISYTESAELEIPEQPTAKSYDEVLSAVSDIISANAARQSFSNEQPVTAVPSAGATAMFGTKSVYSTNTQVEEIDESDIVKTDGKYIYHYRFDSSDESSEIRITSADSLKSVSSIPLDKNNGVQMYLSENRLVLVINMSSEKSQNLSDSLTEPIDDYLTQSIGETDVIIPEHIKKNLRRNIRFTETVIFDISDINSPKEIKRYRQDGRYISSRMSGDMLYLVSSKQIYSGGVSSGIEARYFLPYAGNGDMLSPLATENILIPDCREDFNYAVITSMNIISGTADTQAVLGMADEIMMSKNSLYLTTDIYDSGRKTGIIRFTVTSDGIKYIADTTVDGYIDNQFSLDEHDGNLRIATTSYSESGETVNNIYILDSSLNQTGALHGLAPGERIYSVRYMGNTAYVVTFRETDPLFVIDLSDAAKPTVKGQLKLPGFSEYLHPIDDNTIIALGSNTISTKSGGIITDGLKLSLFDVSDPSSPKEKYNCLIGNYGSYSSALQNHKAFMFYPEKGIFGFPASIYTSYGASADDPYSGDSRLSFSGYLLLRVGENEFELLGTISPTEMSNSVNFMRNDPDCAIERAVYIGDTLYTVSNSGLSAYSLDTLALKANLKY